MLKRQSLFLLVIAFTAPALANYTSSFTMKVRPEWPVSAGDGCGATGLDLTGEGQLITTCDSGIDTANMETMTPDIAPNLIGFDFTYDERYVARKDISGHGTHTAGSIVGTGAQSGGKFKGMAYQAKLWAWMGGDAGGGSGSYVPYNIDEAFRPEYQSSYKNCGLVSHIYSASYGSDGSSYRGRYMSETKNIDEYCWNHPDFLPVWAAANSGYDNNTGQYVNSSISMQSCAKNALVVGATNGDGIAYFSSRGPTLDGRTKPDICAPGWDIISVRSSQASGTGWGAYDQYYEYMGGTSQATPLTAGVCALIREWLIKHRGFDDTVTNKKPTSALIKAIIMGGAVNLGLDKNIQGAGRVNLRSSIAPDDNRAVYLKDRIPFAKGKQTVFTFTTKTAAPLNAQLVWVDYPGDETADQSESKLINDLDLSLVKWNSQANQRDQSFDMCYGNGGTDFDRLNNAESIRLTDLPAGTYKLVVASENIPYDSTKGGAAALYLKGAFDERTVSVRDKLEDVHPVKIIVR